MSDPLNHLVAGAAIGTPFWLPRLSELSQAAALVLPILGAVWLVVQIAAKIIEVRSGKFTDGDDE